jgi:hypothetical protein
MTVQDLISKLQSEDPTAMVLVRGYESGFDSINKLSKVRVSKNNYKNIAENKNWWDGDYEVNERGDFAIAILN